MTNRRLPRPAATATNNARVIHSNRRAAEKLAVELWRASSPDRKRTRSKASPVPCKVVLMFDADRDVTLQTAAEARRRARQLRGTLFAQFRPVREGLSQRFNGRPEFLDDDCVLQRGPMLVGLMVAHPESARRRLMSSMKGVSVVSVEPMTDAKSVEAAIDDALVTSRGDEVLEEPGVQVSGFDDLQAAYAAFVKDSATVKYENMTYLEREQEIVRLEKRLESSSLTGEQQLRIKRNIKKLKRLNNEHVRKLRAA